VAHNGFIAARRLIPLDEATPEAVAAAESTAKRAIQDSVETSAKLESTAQQELARAVEDRSMADVAARKAEGDANIDALTRKDIPAEALHS
jgi:hypothetical protein